MVTIELSRRMSGVGNGDVSRAAMEGVQAELQPGALCVELMPSAEEAGYGTFLWHRVSPARGMTLRLTSTSDEVKIVRLSVACDRQGWDASWPRWLFAVRRAPELIGGHAIDAQDVLSDDCASLTLLVLPGETREATLEVRAVLNRDTEPGHYLCDVHVEDCTAGPDGPSCALAADVELRHPPSKLLDHLPGIYRDAMDQLAANAEGGEAPFFARFLRGFDDLYEPMEQMIAMMHLYFGPFSAPSEFLLWLSTWVGQVLNDNWPEMRRRRLIAEAASLYRWRGTRRGLARYLEIYTGMQPEINDQPFRGWRLGSDALLGQNTVLGDVADHTFVVTIAVPDPSAINEQIVRDIIESEKPAHAGYSLRIVRCISNEEERAAI